MKDRRLTLTLIILSLLQLSSAYAQNSAQQLSRKKSLAILRCCGRAVCSERCDENAAEYLIVLFKQRDAALLQPLLDAGLVSDGALAESLGVFYGDLLWKEPRTFLKAIAYRRGSDQRHLARLAGRMDGSGMPNDMLREVQAKLRRIGLQRNRLAPVARLSLAEVNRANKVEK